MLSEQKKPNLVTLENEPFQIFGSQFTSKKLQWFQSLNTFPAHQVAMRVLGELVVPYWTAAVPSHQQM